MALQNEVSSALSYAVGKGFQIHPDAFAMLKGLNADVLKTVQEIIRSRKPSTNTLRAAANDARSTSSPKALTSTTDQNRSIEWADWPAERSHWPMALGAYTAIEPLFSGVGLKSQCAFSRRGQTASAYPR